jgi:SNF2 family DNA or RNA helicase
MKGASSSKLEAIMQELDEIWRIDPGSKILVFSQFLGFLDIITRSLNCPNIASYRIDGKMSLKERVNMIDRFNKESQTNPDLLIEDDACRRGSVFLVSMKAGGCGLNLVAASSVFIIDPWWNMAIEDVSPSYFI